MALSLASLQRTNVLKPPRILIYGVAGVGKTTFASQAPSPVFLWTEDGAGTLDVTGFPLATSFDDVLQALSALYSEDHGFQTVVIDSLDWLEPLVWRHVCRQHGWGSNGPRAGSRRYCRTSRYRPPVGTALRYRQGLSGGVASPGYHAGSHRKPIWIRPEGPTVC